MNKKLTVIFATMLIALSLAGLTYALWSKTLYIDGYIWTEELDWEIEDNSVTLKDDIGDDDWTCDSTMTPPLVIENITELDKDVGNTTWLLIDSDLDGDWDTLNITVNNVYPCYYQHVDFWVHNNGDVPLKIWKVIIAGNEYYENDNPIVCLDLDGDFDYDIIIRWGNSFGDQIEYCESKNMSFDFHILQPADEGDIYSFTIQLVAIQWNEYEFPANP